MKQNSIDKKKQYMKKWRKENRVHFREYLREWRMVNRDKVQEYQERYWSKKAQEWGLSSWKEAKAYYYREKRKGRSVIVDGKDGD